MSMVTPEQDPSTQPGTTAGKRVLLIVSGGIAAYKCFDLIRRLRERGIQVRCVMTPAAAQFVTPLSLSALSEDKVYGDLFSLTDESEMGHIRLSREADLLLVAPASADILARMTHGLANDLATAVLLATDKPVLAAPSMNVRMWGHAATRANIATLEARGVAFVGPEAGDMACGEYGPGRMSEPEDIVAAVEACLVGQPGPLAGRRALVTSGPTREAIDPVRYLSNYSSGKQGHAVAAALARFGAETVLVTGPVALEDPAGVRVVRVETARDMLATCETEIPVDIAVCAAAVSDWHIAGERAEKMKKDDGAPELALASNPDILQALSQANRRRPQLVVGFAAETENVIDNARAKYARKGCDWLLANDVSAESGTFGGDLNTIHLLDADGVENWPRMSKRDVADQLATRVARHFTAP